MQTFFLGALVMATVMAGVCFLRFWRKTHDRLFAIFAIAFWLMGLNWMTLAVVEADETHSWIYMIRLGAFVLILGAIIDKNRRPRARTR